MMTRKKTVTKKTTEITEQIIISASELALFASGHISSPGQGFDDTPLHRAKSRPKPKPVLPPPASRIRQPRGNELR
jgi:hypothetical protein